MPLVLPVAMDLKSLMAEEKNLIRYFMATSRVSPPALLTRLLLSKDGTFNLHVLGLEPAFILSQDQTRFYYPYVL